MIPPHLAYALDVMGVVVLIIRKPKHPVIPDGWKPAYPGEEPSW